MVRGACNKRPQAEGKDPVPTQADLFLRFLHVIRTMQIVTVSFGHARSDG